jgi:hypothetical protein
LIRESSANNAQACVATNKLYTSLRITIHWHRMSFYTLKFLILPSISVLVLIVPSNVVIDRLHKVLVIEYIKSTFPRSVLPMNIFWLTFLVPDPHVAIGAPLVAYLSPFAI